MSKIQMQIKSPDSVHYALQDALPGYENEQLRQAIIRKFFQYEEILTIEVDTETMKATILEARS